MADRRKSGKHLGSERGFAIVEFGLILPLLLLLLAAVADFGVAFQMKQVLSSAAHEGARIGAVPTCLQGCPRPSASQISAEATRYLANAGVAADQAIVNVVGAGGAKGELLTVEVLYPSQFLFLSSVLRMMSDTGPGGVFDVGSVGARVVAELQ